MNNSDCITEGTIKSGDSLVRQFLNENKQYAEVVRIYTRQLIAILSEKASRNTRTYGFEYEFLPNKPITVEHLNQIRAFLLKNGFSLNEQGFIAAPSGLYITFEPGGQIEYSSLPMSAGEDALLWETLITIQHTNLAIQELLDIEYLAVGYILGRENAPLCLTSERYQSLHARMLKSGTRGREMMKGTASLHLHVSFQNIREILPLFCKLLDISSMKEFRMSQERRNIWDNTDPGRCIFPFDFANLRSSEQLIESIVRFALEAEDIYSNIPFWKIRNITFNDFIEHLTTIYADVRLNLKGPSLELRTPDSIPVSQFEHIWKKFVALLEEP